MSVQDIAKHTRRAKRPQIPLPAPSLQLQVDVQAG